MNQFFHVIDADSELSILVVGGEQARKSLENLDLIHADRGKVRGGINNLLESGKMELFENKKGDIYFNLYI